MTKEKAKELVREMIKLQINSIKAAESVNDYIHGVVMPRREMPWGTPKEFKLNLFEALDLPDGGTMMMLDKDQISDVDNKVERAHWVCKAYEELYKEKH